MRTIYCVAFLAPTVAGSDWYYEESRADELYEAYCDEDTESHVYRFNIEVADDATKQFITNRVHEMLDELNSTSTVRERPATV